MRRKTHGVADTLRMQFRGTSPLHHTERTGGEPK
jgi:hypothetical protein